MKQIILIVFLYLAHMAMAQLTLDRTRLVFGRGSQESQSLVVNNIGKSPLLAQSWIEDSKGEKVLTPLVALPILQRMDRGVSKNIKVQLMTKAVTQLPQDRESLFYLNVLGIPTIEKESEGVGINIVVQTRIKLFYRPQSLAAFPKQNKWLKDVEIMRTNGGLVVTNPLPFHIVIYQFDSGKNTEKIEKDILIAPFSTEKIDLDLIGNTPSIYFIGDEGGVFVFEYQCIAAQRCKVQKVLMDSPYGLLENHLML